MLFYVPRQYCATNNRTVMFSQAPRQIHQEMLCALLGRIATQLKGLCSVVPCLQKMYSASVMPFRRKTRGAGESPDLFIFFLQPGSYGIRSRIARLTAP